MRRNWLFLIVSILVCLAVVSFPGPSAWSGSEVRSPILAGTWYPGDPAELKASIDRMLQEAQAPPLGRDLAALVAPHAGYVYSGPTAAYSFGRLRGADFETVVLIGPSHKAAFRGVAVDVRDYETPLGRTPVDHELAAALIAEGQGLLTADSSPHGREHCLEIELPFIQTVLPGAKIVPMLMGSHDIDTCRSLARTLARTLAGRKVLMVASTDLSHYHSAAEAEGMDDRLISLVRDFKPEKLHAELVAGRVEACGGGALVSVMLAAKSLGADQSHILKYSHSGDVSGDDSRVVGYLAAAFTRSPQAEGRTPGSDEARLRPSRVERVVGRGLNFLAGLISTEAEASDIELSENDQGRLLFLARKAIEYKLEGREFKAEGITPDMKNKLGVFVTLRVKGRLRGCIGTLTPSEALYVSVPEMAVAAAFKDPRFPPLTREELKELEVEISVLSPLVQVRELEEIKVGIHGLMLIRGENRGVLLPQVPLEQGWNKEEYLQNLCLKAGLAGDCLREMGVKLYRFTAFVFSEEE